MTNEVEKLKLENALLKSVSRYNPIGINAVVRALISNDYKHLIDIDESGDVDIKTLDRAITKLKADEPYLFKTEKKEDKGAGGGGTNETDVKKAKMLELMGVEKKSDKGTGGESNTETDTKKAKMLEMMAEGYLAAKISL